MKWAHFLSGATGLILGVLCCAGSATAATPLVVNQTGDSGPGSLRYEINNSSPGDTITFDLPAGSTITIPNAPDEFYTIANDLTITGPGAQDLTIDAQNTNSIFLVNPSVTARITGLTLTHGQSTNSTASGGAIFDLGTLTLNHDVLNGNTAPPGMGGAGGAVFVNVGASLTLENSTVSGNSAFKGGAIYAGGATTIVNSTFTGNTAELGGGEYVRSSLPVGDTEMNTSGSTFAHNTATSSDGSTPGGGAVYIEAGLLSMTNDTLTANAATGQGAPASGGAIFVCNVHQTVGCGDPSTAPGSAALVNDTIDDNSASGTSSDGGQLASNTGTAAVRAVNTIVADGHAATHPNCDVAETSLGHNLSNTSECGFTAAGDKLGVIAHLAALANNGGPTQTMALLTGSPAVDAGLDSACPATDQRGVTRPQGSHCDIGAYELKQAVKPPPPPPKPTCTLKRLKLTVSLPKATKHHHAKPPSGSVTLAVRCDQAVAAVLSGTLTETPKNHRLRKRTFKLPKIDLTLAANATAPAKVKLPKRALSALKTGAHELAVFTLAASDANGSATATASVAIVHHQPPKHKS